MAAVQHGRVYGVRLRVEYVPSEIHDAFPTGRINDGAVHARVVNEVVGVEEQVEVLGRLGKEEGLHAVFFAVVAHIFYLTDITVLFI